MIGVFDSGYGGLTILRGLMDRLPQYAYAYLGDNARAPYGPRTQEDIFQCTREGIDFLFEQACSLVILACNTASANALRRIQRDVLPQSWPGRRVLGILVPTVEQIASGTVVVFATSATVRSRAYTLEIAKRHPSVKVFEQACPTLSMLIEADAGADQIDLAVADCIRLISEQMGKSWPPSAVLLGCTHYALIHDVFVRHLPHTMKVYDQAAIVAEKLEEYFGRHAAEQGGMTRFFTTGDSSVVSRLGSRFFGETVAFTHARLRNKM